MDSDSGPECCIQDVNDRMLPDPGWHVLTEPAVEHMPGEVPHLHTKCQRKSIHLQTVHMARHADSEDSHNCPAVT